VRFIMTRVELIFAAFVHMFSVAFTHAYRRPCELTWLSGIGLLGLMLGFGFSGYLLPWNQISYFATKVGTDVAGTMPLAGPALARFLRGGEDVGAATLTRFFAFHVSILPLITFASSRCTCC
jgi:quinol-cytochrome oxidoreductase complex cytochrome b subunit